MWQNDHEIRQDGLLLAELEIIFNRAREMRKLKEGDRKVSSAMKEVDKRGRRTSKVRKKLKRSRKVAAEAREERVIER